MGTVHWAACPPGEGEAVGAKRGAAASPVDSRRGEGRTVGRGREILSAAAIVGLVVATVAALVPAPGGADLHAGLGLLAGALAAAGHIRWGAGRDLLATLLLAGGVFLGMGVSGELVGPGAHGWTALAAALVSVGVHGEHLWQYWRS